MQNKVTKKVVNLLKSDTEYYTGIGFPVQGFKDLSSSKNYKFERL